MRISIRRALVLSAIVGVGLISIAPAAVASTDIEAYGIQATGLVTVAKQPDATLTNKTPPDVLNVGVTGILSSGTLSASVSQTANSETATAGVEDLSSILAGLGISADALTATCTATNGKDTTGGLTFTNLVVAGTTINANVAPNTGVTITVAGINIATVVINQQTPASPGTGQLTVNGLYISILATGQTITLASAKCGPAPSGGPTPIASGTGLYLGLGLLGFGGLAFGIGELRRRAAAGRLAA